MSQVLQAMDAKQELTALGHHLASLPVDARVGKMLLYAAILGCLDPVSSPPLPIPHLYSKEETLLGTLSGGGDGH